jgi:hypothetical protein
VCRLSRFFFFSTFFCTTRRTSTSRSLAGSAVALLCFHGGGMASQHDDTHEGAGNGEHEDAYNNHRPAHTDTLVGK